MNIVKCSTFHNNHVCSNLIILYYQLNKLNYFLGIKLLRINVTDNTSLTWKCQLVMKQWSVIRALLFSIKQHFQWKTANMKRIIWTPVNIFYNSFNIICIIYGSDINKWIKYRIVCDIHFFHFSPDFSLVDWMVSHSIDHIENIRPPQASELLLQLGLDHFLSEPEKCTLMDDKYGAVDLNGWNNGLFFYGGGGGFCNTKPFFVDRIYIFFICNLFCLDMVFHVKHIHMVCLVYIYI